MSGIDLYDQKLTSDWAVQQIHQRIEKNFSEIQAVINLLIGLTTINIGLLMGPVMGLLIVVLCMFRKVSVLKKCIDLMKSRTLKSVRKGSRAFNTIEMVSGVTEF